MSMKRWERIVDQLLSDAIGDGDVSHLRGAGAPLQMNDDGHTPDEWRTAFKIMNDHEVLPEWIAAAKALDKQERELRKTIAERARLYCKKTGPTGAGARSRESENAAWERFTKSFKQRIRRHNDEALVLNLKLPAGLPRRATLDAERLIQQALESIQYGVESG